MTWLLVTIFMASLSGFCFAQARYYAPCIVGVPFDLLIGIGLFAITGLVFVWNRAAASYLAAIALGPVASYVSALSRGLGVEDREGHAIDDGEED